MTRSIAGELAARQPGRRRRARTLAADFASDALVLLDGLSSTTWPAPQYQECPVDFARDVLGENPWARQIEILEAARDYKRVTVRSGHKIGKSRVAAMIALWFYSSFPDARVVMSSTTSRQVDQILWRELRMMYARSPTPLGPVEDIHELARSGLKAADFREVVGFTAREAEAVAGISGANLVYILDEASGIPDPIFEAIEGNRAGGARVVMFSNPTKTEGEFFESFHAKADFYHCIHVSSEEAAQARGANGRPIPGLATEEWLSEKRLEWGEESPLYKVRAKGDFVYNESGKIVSLDAIEQAEQRWEETEAIGRLVLGLDPAGPGLAGDESAAAPRRGRKVLDLRTWRGLREEDLVREALAYLDAFRRPDDKEKPLVNVDSDGMIGAKVLGLLRAVEDKAGIEVVGVRTGTRLHASDKFPLLRDKLWWNFATWLRAESAGGIGGAIPENTKLEKELHAPAWEDAGGGRVKVTHKEDLRSMLGRSPDRADAVVLSTWVPSGMVEEKGDPSARPVTEDRRSQVEPEILGRPSLDPYAALGAFGRRRGM